MERENTMENQSCFRDDVSRSHEAHEENSVQKGDDTEWKSCDDEVKNADLLCELRRVEFST